MYDKQKKSEYYQNNKDKIKAYHKNRYIANRDDFIEKSKQWAANNREKTREYKRKYKHNQKQILRNLSRTLKTKCSNCSCDNPVCIDWHHLGDKDNFISIMIAHGYSTNKFLEEIAKCIPLCSNCHRKHHFPNPATQYDGEKGKIVFDIKSSASCKECGESYYQCLEFHHRDRATKVKNISIIVRDTKYSVEDLLLEIEKCDILCSNCHRLI